MASQLARKPVISYLKSLFILAGIAIFFVSTGLVSAQTTPVIHWLNDSNQNGLQTLNSTSNFITSFKATNDVHITMITGTVNSIFAETFGGLGGGNNNPTFLTNFIGVAANGTGDGSVGHFKFLEGSLGGSTVLQFDFAVPLTPYDRVMITDVDTGEKYGIQAFASGQAVDLSGWIYTPYSGEGSQPPDSNWPTWSVITTNGTLTANTTGALLEPLSVLTPDRTIDRVVITRVAQGNGSIAMQFLALPVPGASPVLQIQPVGTNVVLTWPATFNNYSLYTATNLKSPVTWTGVSNAPALNVNQLVVTNLPPFGSRYFRLQLQ